MEDTVLVQGGVVILVARYPADETSFAAAGTIVKAPVNTVEPGMLHDGSTFTAPR